MSARRVEDPQFTIKSVRDGNVPVVGPNDPDHTTKDIRTLTVVRPYLDGGFIRERPSLVSTGRVSRLTLGHYRDEKSNREKKRPWH